MGLQWGKTSMIIKSDTDILYVCIWYEFKITFEHLIKIEIDGDCSC